MDNQVAKAMAGLANLAKVEMALRFLAEAGVVKEEAISKGCRKYVKDHPEIQAWIDTGALLGAERIEMDMTTARRMRQWVREVNELGLKYGHEDAAGPLEFPDPDMLDLFKRGLTPEQAIAEAFDQSPNAALTGAEPQAERPR